jgi:hypothetical protein
MQFLAMVKKYSTLSFIGCATSQRSMLLLSTVVQAIAAAAHISEQQHVQNK